MHIPTSSFFIAPLGAKAKDTKSPCCGEGGGEAKKKGQSHKRPEHGTTYPGGCGGGWCSKASFFLGGRDAAANAI
jgi:hypothetical protein